MVVIARDGNGKATIWCDPCIAPLVRALNTNGLQTMASCCGHGRSTGSICLADGRVLAIWPSLESHRAMALLAP